VERQEDEPVRKCGCPRWSSVGWGKEFKSIGHRLDAELKQQWDEVIAASGEHWECAAGGLNSEPVLDDL